MGSGLETAWALRRTVQRLRRACYGPIARGLRVAVARLSDETASELGRRLGDAAYACAATAAGRARRQLAEAFPERTPDEVESLARRCFEHHGMSVVEILRFGRLSRQTIGDYVEVSGVEHIEAALARGRGVIALMAHFGNWELGAAALALNGVPVAAVARDVRSTALNAVLVEQRRRVGVTTLSRQRSLRGIVSVLNGNGVLAILPDVDTAVRGVFVDWFGRPALTPIGPVAISRKYGAPTVPVFLRRVEACRHRLEISPAIEWPRDGESDEDVEANTAGIADVIQDQIRSAPEQWIWMHPRWKTRPEMSPNAGAERDHA